jgi:hypothetical protein
MPENEPARKAFLAGDERVEFLDISALQNVTFGPRSGILGFTSKATCMASIAEWRERLSP